MKDADGGVFQKPAETYEARGRLDPAGFAAHVTFRDPKPPEDLAGFVEHFWLIRWEGMADAYENTEVMHRPYVDAFFSATESGIQGTFRGTRTYIATPGDGRLLGIRFRPGAFHAFWRGEMTALQDKVMPLTEVFPWAGTRAIDALLEQPDDEVFAELAARLRESLSAADPVINEINAIIARVEAQELRAVGDVASAFGRSERWLQQTFRDYLGVGLKWLLQRRRLLAAAAQIRDSAAPDWADLAYSLGYSSQQHFITDFRSVLGRTPVQYKKALER